MLNVVMSWSCWKSEEDASVDLSAFERSDREPRKKEKADDNSAGV